MGSSTTLLNPTYNFFKLTPYYKLFLPCRPLPPFLFPCYPCGWFLQYLKDGVLTICSLRLTEKVKETVIRLLKFGAQYIMEIDIELIDYLKLNGKSSNKMD